jgi:hypothetical protein
LQLYVDGVLYVTVTDASYLRGKIGFVSRRATALIDDVSVTLIE